MDVHKCLSESSILCASSSKCPKLKSALSDDSHCSSSRSSFSTLFLPSSRQLIYKLNLSNFLSLAIFIQSSIPREFNSLKDLAFPLTQLLYSLFISNSDYSNSFLPRTPTKMRICNFSTLYHYCADVHTLFLLSIPNPYRYMVIIIN